MIELMAAHIDPRQEQQGTDPAFNVTRTVSYATSWMSATKLFCCLHGGRKPEQKWLYKRMDNLSMVIFILTTGEILDKEELVIIILGTIIVLGCALIGFFGIQF
ncbi:uncharacterized protein LOC110440472 [Mizuhopecten yessoensis]|uniref:uncharacterized protein LOC110440472 n=1 Tax=Mizuhopecten yessoensis TaxID=6573 RepID=UPI000B45A318|nr:uncharacterized protein LOC110440472 [Mizuhopecten yessoensis]